MLSAKNPVLLLQELYDLLHLGIWIRDPVIHHTLDVDREWGRYDSTQDSCRNRLLERSFLGRINVNADLTSRGLGNDIPRLIVVAKNSQRSSKSIV